MQFFDLHSDTLYKATTENKSLDEETYNISYSKGSSSFDRWYECMAVWIPDDFSSEKGIALFNNSLMKLKAEADRIGICINDFNSDKSTFVLTLENGKLLNNNLENINYLARCGVKMMTLTWNGENCIGGGADTQNIGLKDFGKSCIPELEQNKIIIDVSHTSDKLFFDVAQRIQKPIVASHSNVRKICNHKRNLSDEQIKFIISSKGLIGLNFCDFFLNNSPEYANTDDVLRHAYHILSLGGENSLCIGSDYDGAPIPPDLDSIDKIPNLRKAFIKQGFTEQVVQKIFFDNAHNFFCKF